MPARTSVILIRLIVMMSPLSTTSPAHTDKEVVMSQRFPGLPVPPGTTPRDYRRYLAKTRERWEPGTPVPDRVPLMVVQGWTNMRRLGVSLRGGDPVHATAAELQRRQDDLRMQLVLRAAKTEFFGGTRGMLAVADGESLVLDVWGDREVAKRAEHAGLAARTVWSNPRGGLNAIGCAAAYGRGGVIFAEQHWREDQFCLVCTVWPIRHRNQVVAVINVTDFWYNVYPYTLLALRLFAKDVERALDIEGRQELARMCAAAGWPERISGPALLMDQNGSVINSRGIVLQPGDQVTVRKDRIEAGPQWLPELGLCMLEPLRGTDGWLVRPAPDKDQPSIRVVLEFGRHNQCAVWVQGPTVSWETTICQPQHTKILQLLAHDTPGGGLTATSLAEALYGNPARRDDAKVLMSRLRKQVGGLLATDLHESIDESPKRYHDKSWYRFGQHVAVELQRQPV
ncbi:MAG: hypothetical protein ACRDRY_22735 [Pseudonocardiaceae bacterium]